MNSCDIAKRQNEPFSLKIQYAARCCYNLAEDQNYCVWFFCVISAFSIFLPDRLSWHLIVPFLADIIAWYLMNQVNKNVQKAADLRKYFDAYSIDINADQFSNEEKRQLAEIADEKYSKKPKDANLQMRNSGEDNPPGVYDWYIFPNQYTGLEAKFECQRQNTWWDKKLSSTKYAATSIIFVILILAFIAIALMVHNGPIDTILCSAGLLTKVVERIIDNRKYRNLSIRIDGAQQVVEAHLTIEGIKQLQILIDERRAVNVLGINFLHKRKANKFTKKYNNRSNPH